MYLGVFALLCAVGCWRAWRSNPMYSARTTRRFIVVVTLAVGAWLTAAIGTAQLTASAPNAVSYAGIGAVILCGLLALIWIITQVSLPKVASLDRSAKLVGVHRAVLWPLVRGFGWTMLGFTLLAVAIPGDAKSIVAILGGLTAFLGASVLFAGYLSALHADRSLTAVEEHPWVHWTYTSEQWHVWSDVEVERLGSQAQGWNWRRDGVPLATALVAIAVATFVVDSRVMPFAWEAGLVGLSWIFIIGIIALANRGAAAAPRRLRRLLLRAAPEAYIGPAGVFANGHYSEWQTVDNYLVEATIDDRPPRSLSFRFEKIVPGASSFVEMRQNVLIPDESETDIQRIQTELEIACPKARIALVERSVAQ